MNQVHFASMEDEEDDMYGGFNDLTATDITQVSHDGDDDDDRMIAQLFVLSATTPLLNIAVHSAAYAREPWRSWPTKGCMIIHK